LDAEIVLLPEFDDELKQYNLKFGKNLKAKSEKVFYITNNGLLPKTMSRINRIKLGAVGR